MGASDRAGMLLDSYNLVKAGMMEAGSLVRLLSSYTQEDDATVWEAVEMALGGEKRRGAGKRSRAHFKIRTLVANSARLSRYRP
jgi:hypothetical protein